MPGAFSIKGDRVVLRVKVRPGAGANSIVGVKNDELVVKVKAPPRQGRANRELVAFLSKSSGLPKSKIDLVSGATSQHKVLSLAMDALSFLEQFGE
ncbi:MAG TPA: DUF167 domain-containing protein [Spirochaetia bacterium]|nr:DUF167 domain-containing protein [Spirochaetia bacterium]